MKVVVIVVLILVLAAMSGAVQPSAAGGDPTATTLPLDAPNPGLTPHCGYGHYDNDVRGVVRAAAPPVTPC